MNALIYKNNIFCFMPMKYACSQNYMAYLNQEFTSLYDMYYQMTQIENWLLAGRDYNHVIPCFRIPFHRQLFSRMLLYTLGRFDQKYGRYITNSIFKASVKLFNNIKVSENINMNMTNL